MRPGRSLKGAGVPLAWAVEAARVSSTSLSKAVSMGGAEDNCSWSRA